MSRATGARSTAVRYVGSVARSAVRKGLTVDFTRLVGEYLASLEAADPDRVVALFAEDGIVESPLYGTLPAAEFYPLLFADTASSQLSLRATMTGSVEGRTVVSFWFDFDWTLSNGEPAPFTVVDVAELDQHGLIERLHIVYDTSPIRDAFNNARDEGR